METYEEWDVTIPPLPSRSRLYHLEPIGIGTPYVESLTGYIARLAETHCVTPKNLVLREIMPFQSQTVPTLNYYNYHSRMSNFWFKNALILNGISPVTKQWIERLQSLTSCENLRFLTMSTWSEVIGMNKLLRPTKAWCSACYEEWRQTHHKVYEPLLWALASVTICLRHRQLLVTSCPQCQKLSSLLTQVTRPGYCSRCGWWLGKPLLLQTVETTLNDKEELKHQYWTAEVVGELLACAPHISEPPRKEQIAIMMSLYLEHYVQGNINSLARLVRLNKQPLWSYIRGTQVPYFDTLLHLCSALSITPLEFLTSKLLPDQRNPQFVVDNLPVVSHGRGKPISTEDVQCMRQILEAVIAEKRDPPPSLREVANISGYPTITIRKHCPDLSKRILARCRRRWTEDDFHRMKQGLENALRSDQPVPLSVLVQQLDCDSNTLRKYFPDQCAAIVTRYRERFNHEQIQRRLQEVLANEEETLSVFEVAREMGYNYTIFKNNFPDLCNQIKKRCATARRKHHDERVTKYCNEIRQVALILHDQGKYPSSWQIIKQLSDPHAIRTKEGHETWRQILEELGYPTGHLKKYP